jgi:hypothetical protein
MKAQDQKARLGWRLDRQRTLLQYLRRIGAPALKIAEAKESIEIIRRGIRYRLKEGRLSAG